ncbi:MAG: sigma-70 family RNA polymerase sigma factor [Actinomycetota bacterium]
MVVSEPLAAGVGTDLAQLHREHYRELVRLAALLVDDVGTAEEVVQDAFVTVLGRDGLVHDPGRLPAYLRSAVLNGARSSLRRRSVRRRLRPLRPAAVEPSAEAGAMAGATRRAVLAALRALPDRQRDVLVLRYYLDLPEHEIAATLGIGAGTVKTHARRGLAALAGTLEATR